MAGAAVAPMDEILACYMQATLKALAKERPQAAEVEIKPKELEVFVCGDGHTLRRFCPQVDGFCCEECGVDLAEREECLRCDVCGGFTYCFQCSRLTTSCIANEAPVGQFSEDSLVKTAPHGPGSSSSLRSAGAGVLEAQTTYLYDKMEGRVRDYMPRVPPAGRSAVTPLNGSATMDVHLPRSGALDVPAARSLDPSGYDEDLNLAIALSLSEYATCPVDHKNTTMGATESAPHSPMRLGREISDDAATKIALDISNESRLRCFVCGARTDYPVYLRKELECPHGACGALACRELLHTRWLDIRKGLLDGDHWVQGNSLGNA